MSADAAVQAELRHPAAHAVPAAPHITHALWQELGLHAAHGEIIDAPWPQVDEAALVQDEIELVLQIAASCAARIRDARQVPTVPPSRLRAGHARVRALGGRQAGEEGGVVPGRWSNVVV